MITNPRHGRPRGDYLATLQTKANKPDYDRLVMACVAALVDGERDIFVSFNYTLKFPSDFPKGIIVEEDDFTNTHKIKARKLLDWLHERGYTTLSYEKLHITSRELTKSINSFLQINEIDVDNDQLIDDNQRIDE